MEIVTVREKDPDGDGVKKLGCWVTVFFKGKIIGEPPDLSYQGLEGGFSMEGGRFSEFELCKFLQLNGVDMLTVKGYNFKAPNQPLEDFKAASYDNAFVEMGNVMKEHGGVHIFVDHGLDVPACEKLSVPPLYIGWSEDLNLFSESGQVVAVRKDDHSWEEYSDSDRGTPEGSDEEFVSVVRGVRAEKRKQAEAEIRFSELMDKAKEKAQLAQKKAHDASEASSSRMPKKVRANRTKSLYSFTVKHVSSGRKCRRARGSAAEMLDFWELFDEQERMQIDQEEQHGAETNATELDAEEHFYEPQQHEAERNPPVEEDNVTEQAECGGADNGEQISTAATEQTEELTEEEKKAKEKHKIAIRRYKTMYTSLKGFKNSKKVVDDEGHDFGDRGYTSDHEIDEDRMFCDRDSSSEEEQIVHWVESDPDPPIAKSTMWYNENWDVPFFQAGMKFVDSQQFKRAIQKYAIHKVCGIQTVRNSKVRQAYRCKDDCPWFIVASLDKKAKCFSVKSYCWKHDCTQDQFSKKVTCKWVAEHFRTKVQRNPSFTCRMMMVELSDSKSVSVRFSKCVRAKVMILTELEGNFITEYGVVVGYANYLKEVNPNNTVIVQSQAKTRMPDSPLVFDRMYVCLDVLKDGFKKGCRKAIGIDGTWLKGACKGVLFTAVAKDGNGQMYPIAWAVMDAESYETWSWFLKLLIKDLELGDGENITILSDKHKGILSSVKDLLPKAEHRLCARHFYSNLRKLFNDGELQDIFWAIAKSYDPRQFNRLMQLLSTRSVAAHDALMSHDVTRWCRAFLSPITTCEDPTNNITETFNGWIKEARCLPVISMCQAISNKLMERRASFYNNMLQWNHDICPYPFRRLKRRIKEAKHCRVVWDGHNSFQVEDDKFRMQHVVELVPKTCTCGYWQLTGVPCAHLCACCKHKGWEEKDFVSAYLKKEMYKLAYERPIECIRGSEAWESYTGPRLEPPVFKRRPGRPKKNRIPSTGEIMRKTGKAKFAYISRHGRQMHCTHCQKSGHNIRGCPNLRLGRTNPKTRKTPSGRRQARRDAENQDAQNQDDENQEAQNQDAQNEDVENQDAENPENGSRQPTAATDENQNDENVENGSNQERFGANNNAPDDLDSSPQIVAERSGSPTVAQNFRRILRAQKRRATKEKRVAAVAAKAAEIHGGSKKRRATAQNEGSSKRNKDNAN